jgi:hypothetical protein
VESLFVHLHNAKRIGDNAQGESTDRALLQISGRSLEGGCEVTNDEATEQTAV